MSVLSNNYIAVIDDESSLCTSLSRLLRLANFQPITYPSAESFLEDEKRPQFDCLLLDIRLGGMSGLDLFRHLLAKVMHAPVIFITAFDDPEMRAQAEALGCATSATIARRLQAPRSFQRSDVRPTPQRL